MAKLITEYVTTIFYAFDDGLYTVRVFHMPVSGEPAKDQERVARIALPIYADQDLEWDASHDRVFDQLPEVLRVEATGPGGCGQRVSRAAS